MSATAVVVDEELARMRRSFPRVLLAVIIAFVLLGGLIAAFGTSADRPEGAAERFLDAVSDTTRNGVRLDAHKRVEKLGNAALIGDLVDERAAFAGDGKSAFTEIEVGAAHLEAGVGYWVPYRLHQRDADGDLTGTLLVIKHGDAWYVNLGGDTTKAGAVPSDGGPKIASAQPAVYAVAVLVGLLITVALSALVTKLSRSTT